MRIADISIIGWIHTIACIAALPGPGVFGLFHWFTVFALFFTLLGYFAASRQSRGVLGLYPFHRHDLELLFADRRPH
jgi:hypothetical protein